MNKTNKDYIEVLSKFFEKIGTLSYDHKWLVLFACIIVLSASGYFASTARVDMSFESFFDRDDPTYASYLQYRDDFGSDEVAYILYRVPDKKHGPWDIDIMRKIDILTRELKEKVPFVKKVTSLTNVEFVEGIPGGIKIYDLLEEFPESQEDLLAIRAKILSKPLYVGGIISADAEYAAIIVEMEKSSIDPPHELIYDPDKQDAPADLYSGFEENSGEESSPETVSKTSTSKKLDTSLENLYPQVAESAISQILSKPEYKNIEFFHSGDVPINAIFNRITITETTKLMAISYLVIILLLIAIFRRPVGVIGPIAVVVVAYSSAIGLIGLLGWKIDLFFILLPSLLIAVGVADSVHIIYEFNSLHAELGDRREAIRRTLSLVGPPCLLTSLTTAAGFSAMSISHIKSLAHFAIYSAVGVIAAFTFSVTLLVVFLAFGRRKPLKTKSDKQVLRAKGGWLYKNVLTSISKFDIRYRKMILFLFGIVFIASGIGISYLTVDSNFLNEFSDRVPIKKITRFVDKIMGGTSSVVYLFDTGVPDGIKDPKILSKIERLQAEAEKHSYLVKKTYSIVDIVKDLNQSFHDNNPEYYAIPESKELISQYLLIYEMSGGDDVNDYVSGDFSRARLELRCKLVESSALGTLLKKLDDFIKSNDLESSPIAITGIGALWLKFTDYITSSQIQGILLAFAVIAAMMCFVFRSFKIGMIAMIPNMTPVILTLGVMGWMDLPLDYVRLLIATVAIGIAVDDTIHHVTRYHLEFIKCGDYKKALSVSMQDVGRALFVTSLVLILGFLTNIFSIMDSIMDFGILLATTILTALIADFFLMPALILTFKPFGDEES